MGTILQSPQVPCTNSDYHRFNLHRLTGVLEDGYNGDNPQTPVEEKAGPKEPTANGGSIISDEPPPGEFENLIPKDSKEQENGSIFGVRISDKHPPE